MTFNDRKRITNQRKRAEKTFEQRNGKRYCTKWGIVNRDYRFELCHHCLAKLNG